jgi:hypothetical protein
MMESETRRVIYPVMAITQERLSDRGVKVSQKELMYVIIEFIAKNEEELMRMVQETRRSYDANLRKWLNTPVEVERTDALKEHDSVV